MIDVKNIAEISRMGFVDTAAAGYTSSVVTSKQTGSIAIMNGNANNNAGGGQIPGNREIDQALVERAQRGDQARAFAI